MALEFDRRLLAGIETAYWDMIRKPSFKHSQSRVPARRPLHQNLLDLERPARGERPVLYWSSLAAAIVFHGGLLSYLIGYERLRPETATVDPAPTGGPERAGVVVALPLAKRDREEPPRRAAGEAPTAVPAHEPSPGALLDGRKHEAPAGGGPSFTRQELIAMLDEASEDASSKIALPGFEESYLFISEPARRAAAGRPKDRTRLPGTRMATEAAEEKTSTRDADPGLAESPGAEETAEAPDQAVPIVQAPPLPDGALPEDRGAAGIVGASIEQSPPPQNEPQPETLQPAEERPAAVAAGSPDIPLPEDRGAERMTDGAAGQEAPVAAGETGPAAESEAPGEARVAASPDQALPEDRGADIVLLPAQVNPAPEADPATEAHHPPPEAQAVAAPVDAPNMPLPRRRPVFAKATADPQTSGSTGAAAVVEEKAGKAGDAVEAYRQKVRARLAEFKPSGGAGSGMVVVTFTLSKSGDVSSASILRSSGEPELDESVLAAVRRAAPFPKTPPSARAEQRRFVVPFLFRS